MKNMSNFNLLRDALIGKESREVIKKLIKLQRDINYQNEHGDCLLHDAIRYCNDSDVIQAFVYAGADITLTTSKGDTPLILALKAHGSILVIRKLLCSRTVNEPNNSSYMPLFYVVHLYDDPAVLCEFIRAGADIFNVSSKPLTAFHEALLAGRDYNFVKEFLQFTNMNFDARIKQKGDSLLFCAARGCTDPKVVYELIKAGSNVLLTDDRGNTPLHIALERNCSMSFAQEFVRSHIQLITLRNKNGVSPLKLAMDSNVIRGAVLIKWALLVDENFAHESICLEKLKYYDTLNLLYQMFLKRLAEMKNFVVTDGVTLLDVARREFQNPWTEGQGTDQPEMERVLHFKSGSVYRDILNRVKRPVVLKKSYNSCLTTVAQGSQISVSLDPCSSENVFKYLSEADVLSLVVASVVSS